MFEEKFMCEARHEALLRSFPYFAMTITFSMWCPCVQQSSVSAQSSATIAPTARALDHKIYAEFQVLRLQPCVAERNESEALERPPDTVQHIL